MSINFRSILPPWQDFSKLALAIVRVLAYSISCDAGLAQLVARNLAKVEVAGSNPVARSMITTGRFSNRPFPYTAKWPSGKAEACKAFIPGSNPGFASRAHAARASNARAAFSFVALVPSA